MSRDKEGEGSDFDTGLYEDSFKRFEELGEDQVLPMLVNGQILPRDCDAARVWVVRRSLKRAKDTRRNAMIARKITITFVIVAVVSIIIRIVTLFAHYFTNDFKLYNYPGIVAGGIADCPPAGLSFLLQIFILILTQYLRNRLVDRTDASWQ